MRRLGPAALLLFAVCAAGPPADAEPAAGARSLPMGVPEAPTPAPVESERRRVLGDFLDAHFRTPLAPQGPPPAGFSALDASLAPADCGRCHPQQYQQWRTSLHAGAFSPGFAGQLIEGALAAPAEVRQCQSCHAPLAEQQPFDATGAPQPGFDPELRRQGLACAGCHVREHRRLGPPRRAGLPEAPATLPHGGFEARAEFQQSRFCAPCHQFFDDPGVAGKPVENTYREWSESRFAEEDRSCQSCHMPGRAHTWRGIHDPELVRSAVEVELEWVPDDSDADELGAALVLTSWEVGHAFPTYVTPRVFLEVFQQDAAGGELPGTRREAVIGRQIDFAASPPREVFDTRVLPGESVKLDYAAPRAPTARTLVGRVRVDPGHHYRGVFASLLESTSDPEARALIAEAHRRSEQAVYLLAERRIQIP